MARGVTVTYRVSVQYAYVDARLSEAFDAAATLETAINRAVGTSAAYPPIPSASNGMSE
jgi:hypothetical protein